MNCPFCNLDVSRLVAENDSALALRDGYPASPGHTLIVPKRHIATWFELDEQEQRGILELLKEVKAQLDEEMSPDGYNVGFNHGLSAGQTVMHFHLHVIPRYEGDVDDPTGGVRFVIPERGNYKNPGQIPHAMKPSM